MNKVKGIISRRVGAVTEIVEIKVPDPIQNEALVKVLACGVCHTDLHYRQGSINDDFPFLLGHEAAGIVEKIGPDVEHLEVGDFVVLAWRSPCGRCRSCLKGKPWYCFDSRNAIQDMTLMDGTVLSPALGIGAFSELTLVDAGQAIKVDRNMDPAIAGLLGCGVMAGLGAAINTAPVSKGDSVAIFGCGGVGNASIVGSKLSGATKIIAVDIDQKKLDWAKGFGATDVINALNEDPIEAIRKLTGGNGTDVTIEAVGRPETYVQAFYSRDHAGTTVLVGVPDPSMEVSLPMIEIFGRGGSLKSSWYGDCLPTRDFPLYSDLHLQGKIDLSAFVTERVGLEDLEKSFKKMENGEVIRSVMMIG